ncbi:hypothetical protein MKK68_24955 [Methylobacterium sp. E-016]|uniref:hypothetical protein n=1 Tax=Methylobacterium sp. E-016 TaxID=2836556 RepID=UPI001FB876DC|nr:hypothetical protein [Methylobacterium sp. E-016]MCJ2078847.1 hypothetical protein [Methylobacterium sp. E-016]
MKIQGRIDFKVKFTHQVGRYTEYYGIECKRVAPRRGALARYYIKTGIGKYADGLYAGGHPCAMLVGYVLAPPSDIVAADLGTRILNEHAGASPLREVDWASRYRDARIYEGELPRAAGSPLRLLHALVRMHA